MLFLQIYFQLATFLYFFSVTVLVSGVCVGYSLVSSVTHWWWRLQFSLQLCDPVFEFVVYGFVFGHQPSVSRQQDVQVDGHPLHFLLHFFGVRALCCYLQDNTGRNLLTTKVWSKHSFDICSAMTIPQDQAVHPSSGSAFPSPPAGP